MGDERTIREFQATLPWGAHEYGQPFRARTDPQRDAHHALLHVHKAGGKLAGLLDDLDHNDEVVALGGLRDHDAGKYLADLLICALRVANTWPGGPIDLSAALERRLAEKFPPREGG